MKVLLCTPREYAWGGATMNAPLTMAYLARRLDDDGIESIAVDVGIMSNRENAIRPVLTGKEPCDAMGISVLSTQAEGARRLISLAKAVRPDMYVVVGGVDATMFPQKYLDWGADCAVTGLADGNVAKVFQEQPRGIVPGEEGRIDGRPLWERHVPPPWKYPGQHKPLALPETVVMATRGCPFNCSFCANILYKNSKVRRRDPEDVTDELRWLKEQGVNSVFFYDDELADRSNLAYLYTVLETAKDTGLLYRAQGRCNIHNTLENKELLKELHRLGLKRVLWGVESADDGVLKALNKHLTLEQIDETLAVSHEAGMENFALLMAGMPEEGPEEAKLTRDKVAEWLEKGLVQHFQILPLCLLPGTPLYDRAQKEGWYYQPDPFQFEVTGGTPWLTQGEIADHLWKMREIGKPYGAFM